MIDQSLQPPQSHATFTVVVNPSGSQQHRPSAMHNLYTTIRCFLPSHHYTPTETLPSYVAVTIFLILLLMKLKRIIEHADIANIPWVIVFAPLFISNVWSLGRNAYPLYNKYISPALHGATVIHRGYEGIQEVHNGSNHDREGNRDRIDEENAQASQGNIPSESNSNGNGDGGNSIDQMRESICKETRDICQYLTNVLVLLASFYGKIVALVCLYRSSVPHNLTLILFPAWMSILSALAIKIYDYYSLLPRLNGLNNLRQEYASPAWSTPFVLIMFAMMRGIQPLLISCQLDNSLQRSWSVILFPFWIVAFLGFAIALLLFSFLPYMNPHQSYLSSPLKVTGHKVGYLLGLQIALASIWLFWSVLVIAETLDFHEQNAVDGGSGSSEEGPDDNKGKSYSISTIMTPLILLWITLIVTSPMLHSFTKAFETTLLARSMESNALPILTPDSASQNNRAILQTASKRCYVETVQRVVWLLQTGASIFVVADQKSLSEDALSENTHIIPSSTATSRTSIGSNGSASGITANASGAVDALTNTANSVLDWIAPLFTANSSSGSNSNSAPSSQHGNASNGSSKKSSVNQHTDIEMAALAANGGDGPTVAASNGAYADVMMSSQSAIDMNSGTAAGNANYCVVCLSKPADSVIQDCGHYCCCAGCILSIAKASSDPDHCTCPICRCTFTTVLQLKGKPFEFHSTSDKDRKKTVAISNVTYTIHDSHNLNQNMLRRQVVSEESLRTIEEHPTLLELFI